jgi:hypothetical protein
LKRDVLPPLLINLALYYAIGTVQVNKDCLKLNGTDQLLIRVGTLGRSTVNKNTKS